jgi:hypothetical protein
METQPAEGEAEEVGGEGEGVEEGRSEDGEINMMSKSNTIRMPDTESAGGTAVGTVETDGSRSGRDEVGSEAAVKQQQQQQ